jgi:hypothetical protein
MLEARRRRAPKSRPIPRAPESRTQLRAVERPLDDATLDRLRIVGALCLSAATGLDVCAKRTENADVAAAASALASRARRVAETAGAFLPGGLRKPSTSERLRWDWLASTAPSSGGRPETRVVDEAARQLGLAADAAVRLARAGDTDPRVSSLANEARSIAAAACGVLVRQSDERPQSWSLFAAY